MSFPSTPVSAVVITAEEREQLVIGLSIHESDIIFTGRSMYDLIVEIRPAAFHSLNVIQHASFGIFGERGVVVTCAGVPFGGSVEGKNIEEQFDFFSRCFFPS